jgi:hypothetical protein
MIENILLIVKWFIAFGIIDAAILLLIIFCHRDRKDKKDSNTRTRRI